MYVSNLSICKRFTSTKYRVLITGYPAYPAYYQMFPRRATLRPNFESTATKLSHWQPVLPLLSILTVAILMKKKPRLHEPFEPMNRNRLWEKMTPNNKPPPSFGEKVGWLYLIQADKFLPFSLYKGNWRTSCVQPWVKQRAKKLSKK